MKFDSNIVVNVNGYDYPIDVIKFNGGELNVNVVNGNKGIRLTSVSEVAITASLKSSDDVMALLLVKDAIDRFFVNENYNIHLTIKYLPYARQDRVCNKGEAHSLRVMCDLINNMNFHTVTIFDCHSEVGASLLNNCHNSSKVFVFSTSRELCNKLRTGDYVLVSPDAGSEKSVLDLAKFFSCDMIRATKRRDVATGKIEHIGLVDPIPENKSFLIVDDIGDGCGTFIPLAQQLGDIHSKVELYVTHGIFSKGFEELDRYFNAIYTTDSFYKGDHENVTVIK